MAWRWPKNTVKSDLSNHTLSDGNEANRTSKGKYLQILKFVGHTLKAYTSEGKRSSANNGDSSKRKLRLFNERYTQNGIADVKKPKLVLIMLTKEALQYYFGHLREKRLNFKISALQFKDNFLQKSIYATFYENGSN